VGEVDRKRNADTAVIIPVYCEAQVITSVIKEIYEIFDLVICVDDGSNDNSAELARNAGAVVVRHPMNLGQGAALQTGIEAALSLNEINYFVTFDADGQHDPSDVVNMLARIRKGDVDVVFGSRFLDERTSVTFPKRIVLKLAIFYTNAICGMKLTDAHNGLRIFHRKVAESIHLTHSGMAHATEIVNQIGLNKFRYAEEPVHIRYTEYSKSKGQSLWNSINIFFDLVFR
jgi:glycosyltransferase involved in cell wall biosynthesis